MLRSEPSVLHLSARYVYATIVLVRHRTDTLIPFCSSSNPSPRSQGVSVTARSSSGRMTSSKWREVCEVECLVSSSPRERRERLDPIYAPVTTCMQTYTDALIVHPLSCADVR